MERRTILDDYLDYQKKYEAKYGVRTIVLMEVGSFFEIYGLETEDAFLGKVSEIAQLLGIQKTRKNKSISEQSHKNPLMAGFPNHGLNKFLKRLLDNYYTVVLIEQVTPAPNPKRDVTHIYSPGTYLDVSSDTVKNVMMSLYLETNMDYKTRRYLLSVGISMIDLTTGENSVYETHAPIDDSSLALDEAYRFIHMYSPREIIIYFRGCKGGPVYTRDDLKHRFDIKNALYTYHNEVPEICDNLSYQNSFLGDIFKSGMLSPIEYVDLERAPCGLMAYILLLRYAYEHDETILKDIERPQVLTNENHLVLENNCVYQLNVIPDKNTGRRHKTDSLLSVVDRTSSSLGRRLLHERILNPITNTEELNRRYTIVEKFLADDLWKTFEPHLKIIFDIERLQRKLVLGRIHPSEFYNLNTSYDAIDKIVKLFDKLDDESRSTLLPDEEVYTKFLQYRQEYNNIFRVDEMMRWNTTLIGSNIFQDGIYEEVDVIWKEVCEINEFFDTLPQLLSEHVDKRQIVIKREYGDKYGHYFALTRRRSETLKKNLTELLKPIEIGGITIRANDLVYKYQGTKCRLSSKYIDNRSDRLISLMNKLHNVSLECYTESLKRLSDNWNSIFNPLVQMVARVDLYKSSARISIENGYTRPNIVESEYGYVNADKIRHPIIERINVDTEYVANDLSIGGDMNGMLLYGVNASGKSSLMKSVGLNIILAQAGMWVAASGFTYSPYRSLFTRIGNSDNIFRSQSTFEVEMSELRNIMRRSDKYSLILGDELCSGTESTSAISIVSAGVITLAAKQSSFIFATHLHRLAKMPRITHLDNVCFKHLSVRYDEETGKLIYDRILGEGNGKTIYGLEVCRALDMTDEFLSLADSIRKDIVGGVLTERTSRYNTKVIVKNCEICKEPAVHTHHIKFQCTADDNGMIGVIHKNDKFNLVPLCESCHESVHHDKIKIDGWKRTSEGLELDYERFEA